MGQEGPHFSLLKVLVIMQHKEFRSYGSLECHEGLQIKEIKDSWYLTIQSGS
jgi:hypothetical protein